MGLKSILKAGVDQLPANFKVKKQSLPNMLKKQGVKEEELKFADLDLPESVVTKEGLDAAVKGRKDQFGVVDTDAGYKSYSMPEGRTNPTYRERIYTFKQQNVNPASEAKARFNSSYQAYRASGDEDEAALDSMNRAYDELEELVGLADMDFDEVANLRLDSPEANSRYTSEHFPETPNYLMHSRVYDDVNTFDQPTRVVQEIQSDLHQQARQQGGYGAVELSPADRVRLDELDAADVHDMGEVMDIASRYGYTSDARFVGDFIHDLKAGDVAGSDIPESPYAKTWLAKGMEREVAQAIDDGFGQIAIPIKGEGISELYRGSGVQKWYETKVVDTAKKLAKKNGMDFEIQQMQGSALKRLTQDEAANLVKSWDEMLNDSLNAARSTIPDTLQARHGYSEPEAFNFLERMEAAETPARQYELATELAKLPARVEGTQYAIIKPKGTVTAATQDAAPYPKEMANDIQRVRELAEIGGDSSLSHTKRLEARDEMEAIRVKYPAEAFDVAVQSNRSPMREVGGLSDAMAAQRRPQFKPDKPFTPTLYQGAAVATGLGAATQSGQAEAAATTNLYTPEQLGYDPTKPAAKYEKPADSEPLSQSVKRTAKMMQSETGTPDNIKMILEGQGFDPEEQETLLKEATKYNTALEQGYSDEEVTAFMTKDEKQLDAVETIKPEVADEQGFWERAEDTASDAWEGFNKYNARLALGMRGAPIEQTVASLRTIFPNMTSVQTRTSGYFGNQDDFRLAVEAEQMAKQRIVEAAADRGIALEWREPVDDPASGTVFDSGQWVTTAPDGSVTEVTPGFWASMKAEAAELTGGVAGALEGARTVSKVTKNPYAVGFGSLIGAMVGAGVGSEVDYLAESIAMQESLSMDIAAHKVFTAAEVSAIGDTIGYPIAKGLGVSWGVLKQVKDYVVDGNSMGAVKKLKADLNMSDDEARILVQKFERLGTLQGGKQAEKEIAAIVQTQPSMQDVVKVAGTLDSKAARAVAKTVDNRAKDLLDSTAGLTEENAGKILIDDLGNYTNDVKAFYQGVKETAAKHPKANTFNFDFEKLAISPIIDKLQKNITDQNVAYKFAKHAENIKGMSDSRSFSDLLELRTMVNDWRFNKRITKAKDHELLHGVIKEIDEAIDVGAKHVMGDEAGKNWLRNFGQAKTQYAQMKGLERNVFARALRTKGISEDMVTKRLVRYVSSVDGTFNDVISTLPIEARGRAEGSIVHALTEKYTVEMQHTGTRAVDFVSLADDLDGVVLTTPDARRMRDAVGRMSEVFKNDVPLSISTGQMPIPKFQSYLTTDPVVRAKYEIASGVFNAIKRYVPGSDQATNLAIINKTSKLLEAPLNQKSAQDLMKAADGDVVLTKQIIELQQKAAAAKASSKDKGAAKVNVFAGGKLKGTGTPEKIAIHRIASTAKVKELAKKYMIDPNDVKAVNHMLKSEGYLAVQHGSDRVRKVK